MKKCEIKDCGLDAHDYIFFADTDEVIFFCKQHHDHLVALQKELKTMTRDEQIERLRKVTSPKEFERIMQELGELPVTNGKDKNEYKH